MPNLWLSFPEIFAGGKVPFVAEVAGQTNKGLSRALRIAINKQYEWDSKVKFRQIDLENDLSKLFVDLDLDVNLELLSGAEQAEFQAAEFKRLRASSFEELGNEPGYFEENYYHKGSFKVILLVLLEFCCVRQTIQTIRKILKLLLPKFY